MSDLDFAKTRFTQIALDRRNCLSRAKPYRFIQNDPAVTWYIFCKGGHFAMRLAALASATRARFSAARAISRALISFFDGGRSDVTMDDIAH